MSECANCSGGLHPICAGNCYCGCPTSHRLEKHVSLHKYKELEAHIIELEEKQEKINISVHFLLKADYNEEPEWFKNRLRVIEELSS